MKKFCPLASGSRGNCHYLETDEISLLIDAGISFKAIRERLEEIDVDIGDIDAVLITHEHGDHIRGLDMLTKKLGIPVFANSDTAKASCQLLKERPKFKVFTTGESFEYEDVMIHPFSIMHDTMDPVAFTFTIKETKVGICTDLGHATSLVKTHLKNCDYLVIEANHEVELVHACPRPYTYKQRVLGKQGHLSNAACAEVLLDINHEGLKHVYLGHLSSECNHPKIALEAITKAFEDDPHFSLTIAWQDQVSESIVRS